MGTRFDKLMTRHCSLSAQSVSSSFRRTGWTVDCVFFSAELSKHTMASGQEGELVRLLEVSRAFKLSKALNLAGKLKLVSLCATNPSGLTAREICEQLGFRHCLDEGPVGTAIAPWPEGVRGAVDFLDLLVSMKALCRTGDGPGARYTPHPDTARYLLDSSPDCITGILALNNDRSSVLFNYLEDGLRHGQVPETARQLVPDIESTFSNASGSTGVAGGAEHFAMGMLGASRGNFVKLAQVFDFSKHQTVVDIGGSTGCCCVALCESHSHLKGLTCDLPALHATAQAYVDSHHLRDSVQVRDLDFFSDEPFPEADVIIMGMVLHDWGLARKKLLISKAKAALRPGGALIAVENLVDDERRQASAAMASSLNMLLEFGREAAFDFSFQEFKHWTQQQGFKDWLCLPLVENTSAAIAFV